MLMEIYEIIQHITSTKSGGMVTDILLLMIWFASRKTNKEIKNLREGLLRLEIGYDLRIAALEQWKESIINRKQN